MLQLVEFGDGIKMAENEIWLITAVVLDFPPDFDFKILADPLWVSEECGSGHIVLPFVWRNVVMKMVYVYAQPEGLINAALWTIQINIGKLKVICLNIKI